MIKCGRKGCERKAVATLHYMNMSLCKKHFKELFEKRVKRTTREFGLLKKNDKLALALSGGKDSTALLYALKPVCDSMRIHVEGIYINEGTEGYCVKKRAIAERNCEKLGVPLHEFSFAEEIGSTMDEIAGKEARKATTCAYCGVFKRWIVNKKARELGFNKVATGHNLDDSAQTVLMNMMRNEPFRLARFGPKGGIVEAGKFITRIKPLFKSPERENALYAMLNDPGIVFGPCKYSTEAFRDEVRDFLNRTEEKHPGTKIRIVNSFLSIKPSLENGFGGVGTPGTCSECGEPTSGDYCKCCEMRKELEKK